MRAKALTKDKADTADLLSACACKHFNVQKSHHSATRSGVRSQMAERIGCVRHSEHW